MSNNMPTWKLYSFSLATVGSPDQDFWGWSLWAGVIGGPLLWGRGQQAGLRRCPGVTSTTPSKLDLLPVGWTYSEQPPDTREHLDLGGVLRSVFWESRTLTRGKNRAPSNPTRPARGTFFLPEQQRPQVDYVHFQNQDQTQSVGSTPKTRDQRSLKNNYFSHYPSHVLNLTKKGKLSNMLI